MKYLLFLLILLIPFLGISQEKIKGVGPFIIGETTTPLIDKISQHKKAKIKISTKLLDIIKAETEEKTLILQLMEDPKAKLAAHPSAAKLPEERVYFINHFEVSGIELKEIFLMFWDDTLYDFQCNAGNEMIDAVKAKYGDPETEKEEKTVTCRNGLGIQFTEKEQSFYSTWNNADEGLNCFSIVSIRFGSDCKPRYTSNFNIKRMAIFRLRIEKLVDLNDKEKSDELKAKKKKLTEF